MNQLITTIFTPTQLSFEGIRDDEKFQRFFLDLYRIELFKDGLDLILSKVRQKHLGFEVKIIKGWDTNVGCFLTEKKSVYDKALNRFFHNRSLKIILRQLTHNVLAHEMAHALEYESGLNLGEEFRTAIGLDMKDRNPQSVTLKAEIKRLMVDALKSYPPHQFISELFARYFELLSISRNVNTKGDFTTSEVMEFFENTTNFIEKIFNPQIRSKIDPDISDESIKIAKAVKLIEPEKKFQDSVKKSTGSWTGGVRSNASWQNSYKKFEALEEKK